MVGLTGVLAGGEELRMCGWSRNESIAPETAHARTMHSTHLYRGAHAHTVPQQQASTK